MNSPVPQTDGEIAIPAGAPKWITAELIVQTIQVWQPYYAVRLNAEDALAMILSVSRLHIVLGEGLRS